jgi:hypothetical protein
MAFCLFSYCKPKSYAYISAINCAFIAVIIDWGFSAFISAIAHLDKVKVWGKNIRVTQSKHTLVQMPKEGQPVSVRSGQVDYCPSLYII